jgi:hypothetical protein
MTCFQLNLLCSMSNQSLMRGTISVAVRLSSIDNFSHCLLFLLSQFNIPRFPVFLQTRCLGCSGDGDQSLGGDPGKRDLANLAPLTGSELLYFLDDGPVLVEVLALEFGNYRERLC